jgi:Skp family chaperone for outer membrane proteins
MHTLRRPRLALASALVVTAFAAWQAARAGWTGPSVAPAPPAVAIVSLERLSDLLNERKDRDAAHAARVESYQKQLDQAVNDMKIAEDDLKQLKKGDPTLNAKRLRFVEAEAVAKARMAGLNRIRDIDRGDILSEIYGKVVAAAQQIAEREGYDLVMLDDRSIQPPDDSSPQAVLGAITARRVLYASSRLDITELVAAKMNNDYAANKGKK